jgi:hypothetical protein
MVSFNQVPGMGVSQMPGTPSGGMASPRMKGGGGGGGGGEGDGGMNPYLMALLGMGALSMMKPGQEVFQPNIQAMGDAGQLEAYRELMNPNTYTKFDQLARMREQEQYEAGNNQGLLGGLLSSLTGGMFEDSSADFAQQAMDARLDSFYRPMASGGPGWGDMLMSLLPAGAAYAGGLGR